MNSMAYNYDLNVIRHVAAAVYKYITSNIDLAETEVGSVKFEITP